MNKKDVRTLGQLLQKFGIHPVKMQTSFLGIEIKGASSSSSGIKKDFVFFALKGQKVHGAQFAGKAAACGAAAIFIEPPVEKKLLDFLKKSKSASGTLICLISQLRSKMAGISNWVYREPSKRFPVVAVTGTNGKTTTCYMLESIGQAAGKRVGVLGTVSSRIDGKIYPASLTTPQADELFGYLSQMLAAGCSFGFLEATSQALDFGRLDCLEPAGAVFTNLTRDHLDYHKTMEKYYKAKKKLFSELLAQSSWTKRFAAVNRDDPWGLKLFQGLSRRTNIKLLGFGIEAGLTSDISAFDIVQDFNGTSFFLKMAGVEDRVYLKLFGRHNVSNALASAAAAAGLGIGRKNILKGLGELKEIPGRLQKVESPEETLLLVDYAHTDDALKNVLAACREIPSVKRLVVVFGCGGDRDHGKRPLMGQAAVTLADFAVVTSDNPRSEKPEAIIQEIENGIQSTGKTNYRRIVDRAQAIFWAIENARPGDCIVIAGKGHETYQILGSRTIHFDDREVARQAMLRFAG